MKRKRRKRPDKLPLVIELLAQKRREAQMTRRALAAKLGYCHNTIQLWETGCISPTFHSLMNWCEFFGVTLTVTERSND